MLTDTARQRLQSDANLWLATVRPDGRPHLAPVWFVFHAERMDDRLAQLAAAPAGWGPTGAAFTVTQPRIQFTARRSSAKGATVWLSKRAEPARAMRHRSSTIGMSEAAHRAYAVPCNTA